MPDFELWAPNVVPVSTDASRTSTSSLPQGTHSSEVRGILQHYHVRGTRPVCVAHSRARHLLGCPAHTRHRGTSDHGVRRSDRHRRIRPSPLTPIRLHQGAVQSLPGAGDQPSRRAQGTSAGAFARRVRRGPTRPEPFDCRPVSFCTRARPSPGLTRRGGGPQVVAMPVISNDDRPCRSPGACCPRASPTTGAMRSGWPRSGTRAGHVHLGTGRALLTRARRPCRAQGAGRANTGNRGPARCYLRSALGRGTARVGSPAHGFWCWRTGGHMGHIEEPERFRDAVRAFVRDTALPGGAA